MMKRKYTAFVLTVLLVLSFGSCGNTATTTGDSSSDEPHYADQDFIDSVSKGLEARWEFQE